MKQIEFNKNQLIVTAQPPKGWVIVVLQTLSVILLLFIGLMFYGLFQNGLHFGYGVGFVVNALLMWYFYRMIMWNKYGKEIFTIEDKKIKYIADYGRFKDGAQQLEFTTEIVAQLFEHQNRESRIISFHNQQVDLKNHKSIDSVIEIKNGDQVELHSLEQEINVWLRSHR